MREFRRETVAAFKVLYPKGTRIRLIHMGDDDPMPIEDGAEGTVTCVDDGGTIWVDWDNGRGLGLVPGVDHFVTLKGGDA